MTEPLASITPEAPRAKTGRPPLELEAMPRIHFMQQWFGLSDPAMEEALFDVPLYREFADFTGNARMPRVSILRFCHLLEAHGLAAKMFETVNAPLIACGLLLKAGTAVDATIIAASSSTKNSTGARDPEMHQTKKGNQWHFGIKAPVGVDAGSGLVHTLTPTAANAHDVTGAAHLLHGAETDVYADSGYRGTGQREEIRSRHPAAHWHVAMMPGKPRGMDKSRRLDALADELERTKVRIRSKVEHPFRVVKHQFGHMEMRYPRLQKNTQQLRTLSTLANLWLARQRILQTAVG